MDENCKDCPYIKNLDDRVDKLENTMEGVEKDMSEIKISQGKAEEKVITIFKSLQKIESSVDKIKDSKNNFIKGIASGVAVTVIAAFYRKHLRYFTGK
ncbi:hypothetical protein [Clostridium sp. BJN0013]|uniref:hypothetical protein n=1 Tax=Clostridium sp. BJN0013 TaxID=3236840 RepID=UPI0034C68EC2